MIDSGHTLAYNYPCNSAPEISSGFFHGSRWRVPFAMCGEKGAILMMLFPKSDPGEASYHD